MTPARTMRLTPALVALCHREIARDDSPDERDYFVETHYQRAVDGVMAGRPDGAFWLFVYGSLIWKPEFDSAESLRGTARGWHRAFSLRIDRYRATAEQHGYMMCLDPGGHCEGMLLRLDEDRLRDQLHALLFREVGNDAQLESVRWIEVEHGGESKRALTFYAGPAQLDYYRAGRPLPEVAHGLARACGSWGSGADYLHNTVAHLEQLGIHDDALWHLQELVADEIRALYKV